MTIDKAHERRFSRRFPLNCMGSLLSGNCEIPVTVKDISREGIGFYADADTENLDISDDFKFQFIDYKGEIVMGAATLVRLVQDHCNTIIGCRQVSLVPDDYARRHEKFAKMEELYS